MMRGRPTTHLKHLLITGGVAAIILFILWEVATTSTGKINYHADEFTGPGFQTDPYILLAIVGLSLVIFGLGLKYMRMGRAGDSE
jgi:hypothetical protein